LLIVDDHAAVRRAVGEVLAEGLVGAAVGEAATGEEAARLVSREDWDLVVLDLSLGGGAGGLETLRELRRLRPALPVVVMSMHPEVQYGAAARAAGACGYVAKGGAPAAIVDAARAALGEAGARPAPPAPTAVFPAPWHAANLEEERRRLARCLHDEVGQTLAAAKISLGLAASAPAPDEIRRHAAQASTLVAEAIDSLRRVVARMRPPLLDELGLVPALAALLAGLGAERGGDTPTLEGPPDLPRAAPEQEIAAFRVVEQAASTVLRNAPAGRGRVTLRQDGPCLLIAVSGGDTTLRFELTYLPRGER
jgi:signal transduction histidine kinase